jgi:hypothetical protein
MLIHSKYKIFTLLVVLFFVSGIIACKDLFKNPLEDKETGDKVTLLLLNRDFITTKIVIRLEDLLNQQLITSEPITLQFSGTDASNLITFGGKKQTTYTTSTGYVEIGYDPNQTISTQEPIELTVIASNSSYISAPLFLSYTSEGTKDVAITMYPISTLKSAKIAGFNEPYDISLNGQLQSPSMQFLADISAQPTGTTWVYRNLYRLSSNGTVACSNLKDNFAYTDFGIYYFNGANSLAPPASPTKNVSLQSGSFVYSAVQPSGKLKCDKGLKIHIASADGKSGSGSFTYQLTFSDGSVKSGRITCSFPSDNMVEQIYYPSTNQAVKVELFSDLQYDVSSAVNVATVCDGTANFTVTSKSGLKTYKLVTRYSCPDSNVGMGLSIPGEFRKKDSSDPWTTFQFVNGICLLQLTAGQDYEFRVNIDSKYHSYILPTDPAQVASYLTNSNSTDFKFRNLEITDTSSQVTISCDVEFSQIVCDEIDTDI